MEVERLRSFGGGSFLAIFGVFEVNIQFLRRILLPSWSNLSADGQYKEAEADLDLALKHCHRDAKANKRRILNNLVPLKLRLG